jgi:hypothetical protein
VKLPLQKKLLWAMSAASVTAFLAACATAWSVPQARYAAVSAQCVAEAGTRAQADSCRCQVRQQYPSAAQCAELPDGGWILPPGDPGELGPTAEGGAP